MLLQIPRSFLRCMSPFLARNRRRAMSAIWSLSKAKRTCRGHSLKDRVWPVATNFTLGPDVSFQANGGSAVTRGRSFVGAVIIRRVAPHNERERATFLACHLVARINQFNLLGPSDDQTGEYLRRFVDV